MADELNQQVSSQPSATEGTNDAGKPSEPVVQSTMTPSQSTDYYNKTQQLAQERRAFEEERNSWYQARQNPGPQQQYPQQQPGYAQPQGFVPQAQPIPTPQPTYAELVQEFGVQGANAIARSLQQLAQPVQQQIAIADARLNRAEMIAIESDIKARGRDTYGQEWNQKGDQVMDVIKKYGIPLEMAWNAISGPQARQAGIDAAYQAQATKQAGNVAQQQAAPAANSNTAINSFADAFNAAMKQHSA